MATKSTNIPQYGTTMRGNIQYYRTRILDADGKQVSLYATTCEELFQKEKEFPRFRDLLNYLLKIQLQLEFDFQWVDIS